MSEWLDSGLGKELREVMNSSPIFLLGNENKHFNLICAVMDRLDTCVSYINENQEQPKSKKDLIVFVLFGCMVVDAVKMLSKELELEYGYSNENEEISYKYFKEICLRKPLMISKEKCPTDDRFFEYFRALVFAHPFNTDRPKFLEDDEVQYSPWVISNGRHMAIKDFGEGGIGVRIYSSKYLEGSIDLVFPFSTLMDYIKSRYLLIGNATKWANQRIEHAKTEWKKRKVNRSLSPVDTLKEIVGILKSRYEDSGYVEEAIYYLEGITTFPENNDSVDKFRSAIIATIPAVCGAVDALDNEQVYEVLGDIIGARPKRVHNQFGYQLEKIFLYLNDDYGSEYIAYGRQQAEHFSIEFARKHVTILPYDMSFAEIKLLVATACYLEYLEQESTDRKHITPGEGLLRSPSP